MSTTKNSERDHASEGAIDTCMACWSSGGARTWSVWGGRGLVPL